jgi:peptide/nickel transport system substrate-binding protein
MHNQGLACVVGRRVTLSVRARAIPWSLLTSILLVVLFTLPVISTAADSPQQLTVAYYREADTLNPFAAVTPNAQEMNVVEGFQVTNDKMQYIPEEVQEIPTTANGGVELLTGGQMVVTWKLKPGLKWSDGYPATSADAKFTYEALMNPNFRVSGRDGWVDIAKFDTPDTLTVRVTFRKPYAAYNDLFRYLLPKHLLEGKDLNTFSGYNRAPLTTGAYMVKEWVAGQHIITIANPYYRGAGRGLPRMKQIIWRFVSDDNTRINMLKAGEVQIAWAIPFDRISELRSEPGITMQVFPLNAWIHFDFSFTQPLFQDLWLRRAVAYAIDKNALVKDVLGGMGKPAGPPMTPFSWAYNPRAYSQYVYDPDRARKLIAEAGWALGPNGIYVKDGQPLSFLNCAPTGDATQDKVQLVVQAMLRAVGMEMRIQNYSPTVFGAIRVQGRCETLMHRWIVPPTPFLSRFYSTSAMPPNGLNHLRYDNPTFDRIIAQAEGTVDQAKAKPLFWQAQEILAQDLPSLPLYYMYAAHGTVSKLQGFVGNPTNDGAGWNIEEWALKP